MISLIIEAAIAGIGAAILPTYLIDPELSDGCLLKLATLSSNTGQSYFAGTPIGQAAFLATAFTAWLRKQVIKRV